MDKHVFAFKNLHLRKFQPIRPINSPLSNHTNRGAGSFVRELVKEFLSSRRRKFSAREIFEATISGPFFTVGLSTPPPVLAFQPVQGTSNGRKRVFRAVAAATSVAVEWIFLAFPLAAVVTRLRLKYLLVDFATMGNRLPLLPPFSPPSRSKREPSRATKNSPSGRKKRKKERKFYVTFPLCVLSLASFHLDEFPLSSLVPFNLLLFS